MSSNLDVPTTDLEAEALANGARYVAGVDEVGRGALGGPVVASAVVLGPDLQGMQQRLADVRDSKALTASKRLTCAIDVFDAALAIGVGCARPCEIDALGVRVATEMAASRALAALPFHVDLALVDGYPMRILRVRQRAVVKGDRTVLSIAAASVIAKVTRDAMMIELSGPGLAYMWHQNKGYGAPAHLRALAVLGPTSRHRLTWAPIGSTGHRKDRRQSELPGLGTVSAETEPSEAAGATRDPAARTTPHPALALWRMQQALDPGGSHP